MPTLGIERNYKVWITTFLEIFMTQIIKAIFFDEIRIQRTQQIGSNLSSR